MIDPAIPKLFKKIAEYLWKDLGQRHKFGLDKAEIGITDDIIFYLKRFTHGRHNSGITIWKAKDEVTYGHDIDLFIQDYSQNYYWFPLQAKVLFNNKIYKSVKHESHQQWTLLKRLKRKSQAAGIWCEPYYLFYNGFTQKSLSYYVARKQPHGSVVGYGALGCSLVDPYLVGKACIKGANPKYSDFHTNIRLKASPRKVLPWHKIFNQVNRKTRNLPVVNLLTNNDIQNRSSFYSQIVEPAYEAIPQAYYYPGPFTDVSLEDESRGRYMVVINQVDIEWLLFSTLFKE
ncbi:hypothetical protein GCM10011375_18980 [Hymenobacter qilianensis]|uniref:Uncharacterized protein n=2 Tax=Hymenobacter qilianensis TaxID=1385715 RepID=A0ACB5PRB5_9BACT|nr:DUF6615 family protein [Hymenobacter qilianensis]QNP52071.1 hypothetical protein H9L05_19610 [Hymenobacter qilianensis]GGF64312.1 hypothetical protein GCM10011375_18980 [Hymenobacter qilianensis]